VRTAPAVPETIAWLFWLALGFCASSATRRFCRHGALHDDDLQTADIGITGRAHLKNFARSIVGLDPVAHETGRDRYFERAVVAGLQRQGLEPAAENRFAELVSQFTVNQYPRARGFPGSVYRIRPGNLALLEERQRTECLRISDDMLFSSPT
jgi:hypothetical protein